MNRLKELRRERHLTQREVAQYLGVTASAFSYYEAGKRDLSVPFVIKLAEYFSVTTDYLLGGVERKIRKCVFAGTFDPFTRGHEQTVNECLKLFDEVVIAVMVNRSKTPLFTTEERLHVIELLYGNDSRVKVVAWEGIAVDLLQQEGTPFYVRGLRNESDYEYENADFYASCHLYDDLTEVYLPCRQEYLHISSSIVKNALNFSKPIDGYVSGKTKDYILQQFSQKQR